VRSAVGIFAANRSVAATIEGIGHRWLLVDAQHEISLTVRKSYTASTQLQALVQHETCAPLVDALLARLPALGPAALVAALEAEGVEPYRRLVARTQLCVGEEAVQLLLHVPEEGGGSRWSSLVLQRAKLPLLEELMAADVRLHAAAHGDGTREGESKWGEEEEEADEDWDVNLDGIEGEGEWEEEPEEREELGESGE